MDTAKLSCEELGVAKLNYYWKNRQKFEKVVCCWRKATERLVKTNQTSTSEGIDVLEICTMRKRYSSMGLCVKLWEMTPPGF